ncbi:hypothetical protein ACH4ND_33525 [Streptomyces sp. NPDC017179]|uniref:hypothetical protein n=1 Tax=Streptomyces sp. NPDC017179 TaxID=3364979 RepID=UPI0037B799A5
METSPSPSAVLDESYEQLYLVMELADGTPFGDYVDPDQVLGSRGDSAGVHGAPPCARRPGHPPGRAFGPSPMTGIVPPEVP